MELKDTVKLMLSDDWRERMLAEWLQLKIRQERLVGFINAAEQGKTKFASEEGRKLLKKQRLGMEKYKTVLEYRMTEAGIDFNMYESE